MDDFSEIFFINQLKIEEFIKKFLALEKTFACAVFAVMFRRFYALINKETEKKAAGRFGWLLLARRLSSGSELVGNSLRGGGKCLAAKFFVGPRTLGTQPKPP